MGKKTKNKSSRKNSQGGKSDEEAELIESSQPPPPSSSTDVFGTGSSTTAPAAVVATTTSAPAPTPAAATTTTTAAGDDDDLSSPTPPHVDYSSILNEANMLQMVRQWIQDDIPSTFDVGALVVGTSRQQATLWMKSSGVFAGKSFFDAVFGSLGDDCRVVWNSNEQLAKEGCFIDVDVTSSKKIALATVYGPINKILQGERTALNTLSRCSGVATAARAAVEIAKTHGWKGYVAGTRKTTPGAFRIVEKYGLLVGGAATHRLDLSQMVMLKDNHVMAANSSITQAVQLARRAAGFSQKIEVECQSLDEALEAARAGADIVMLDNYTPQQLKHDALVIKQQFPHVLIEASGGITETTMGSYLDDNVDIVSLGKLTQGYACLDFSLKVSNNYSSNSQGKAVSIPLVQQKVPTTDVIKVAAATIPIVMQQQQQVKASPVVNQENGTKAPPKIDAAANGPEEENFEFGSLLAKFGTSVSPKSSASTKQIVSPPSKYSVPELPIASTNTILAEEAAPVVAKTDLEAPVVATEVAKPKPTPAAVVEEHDEVEF
jgi:nicotinate-nucleotide pyrophosphorylase (carboxylating)